MQGGASPGGLGKVRIPGNSSLGRREGSSSLSLVPTWPRGLEGGTVWVKALPQPGARARMPRLEASLGVPPSSLRTG